MEPQGRAFRANLSAGDVIRELDGVVVRGASDFIPPPNAKSSLLLLQRGPDSLALRVDSSGYRYSSPDTLLPSLFAIGLLLAVFGVVQSPLGRWLSLFERRLSERLRESRVTASVVRRDVPLWRAFKSLLAQQLPESFLPYLVVVGASSLFSLLSLSKSVIWAELDVVLLPAVTLTGLFVNAFIAGGSGAWTLRGGLARAFSVLLFNVPFALWIVATAWWAGSLRVSEVVGLQGAFPWQWAVFKSPVLGVLTLTSLLARVATVRPSFGLSRREPESTRQRALSLTAFAHTSCVTGMLALLGFGGYALPFAHTSAPAAALSVALMLGKAAVLMLLIAFLRWVFGAIDVVTAARGGFVWLVLPSLGALGLAASFAALGGGPTLATLAQGVPPTAFVASLVLTVWVFTRVARAARTPLSSLRIQSWL
ncbi:MAG: hypothetical protein QM756_20930 [Polyangiaceae bacterium]